MRRLLMSLASCGAAAASRLPTLESRGATFKTLRDIDVYRPSGERLTLRDLLPEPQSEDRAVVVLLRHFG